MAELILNRNMLQSLSLCNCQLSLQSLVQIGQCIEYCTNLESIDLSHNLITRKHKDFDNQLKSFISSLNILATNSRGLMHANYENMGFKDDILELIPALIQNRTIVSVHLSKNMVSDLTQQTIKETFEVSKQP